MERNEVLESAAEPEKHPGYFAKDYGMEEQKQLEPFSSPDDFEREPDYIGTRFEKEQELDKIRNGLRLDDGAALAGQTLEKEKETAAAEDDFGFANE